MSEARPATAHAIPSLYGHETPASNAAIVNVITTLDAMFITSPIVTGPYERVAGLTHRLVAEIAALPPWNREVAERIVTLMLRGGLDARTGAALRAAEPAGCA